MPDCTIDSIGQHEEQNSSPVTPERQERGKGLPLLLATMMQWCGIGLALLSFLVSAVLISYDLRYQDLSPHKGVIAYLIAPTILGSGLSVIAAVWMVRFLTRSGRQGLGRKKITIDLENNRHTRKLTLAGFMGVTLIGVLSLGGYHSYHFTESTQFCGIVCHEVMKPHYVTHQNSPHAEVGCVECHVGDGAEWYVRTKLNGLREVRDYLSRSYELPIKSPLKHMRPARETCEECHWPEKFTGNREKSFTYFGTDKENSPYSIRLLLKVGGGSRGSAKGIHWHVTGGNKVEYIAPDETRQSIPWVRVTDTAGRVTEYRSPQSGSEVLPATAEIRTMDCVDCHNRPSHVFQEPDDAINQALLSRKIDPSLPSIKETSLSLLQATYGSTPEALRTIDQGIRNHYVAGVGPIDASQEATINAAINTLQKLYEKSSFPEGRVDWTTHPDFIGHFRWDGCFRCHDGMHSSDDGEVISNDCTSCHLIVGQGQGLAGPSDLPYQVQEFIHPPDGAPLGGDTRCSECHGAPPATDYSSRKTEVKVIAAAD